MERVVGSGIKIIHFAREILAYFCKTFVFSCKRRGDVMNRLVYFLMVGLAFTVLQVSTVAAQTGDPNVPPPTGATGMPPMGDSCMTVPAGPDRDACYSSMSGSSMPPGSHDGPPGSHDGPPPGEHHDGPPPAP